MAMCTTAMGSVHRRVKGSACRLCVYQSANLLPLPCVRHNRPITPCQPNTKALSATHPEANSALVLTGLL